MALDRPVVPQADPSVRLQSQAMQLADELQRALDEKETENAPQPNAEWAQRATGKVKRTNSFQRALKRVKRAVTVPS